MFQTTAHVSVSDDTPHDDDKFSISSTTPMDQALREALGEVGVCVVTPYAAWSQGNADEIVAEFAGRAKEDSHA